MTEQITPGAGELSPEKERQLIEEIAVLKQDKANLTSEIQETRKKKQEAEEELKKVKQPESESKDDVAATVEKVLSKKAEQEAAQEREEIEEDFKTSKTEFTPENDPAGLKYAVFQKELKKFNLAGLSGRALAQRLDEVYKYMNRESSTESGSNSLNASVPSSGGQVKVVDPTTITPAESEVIKRLGWTKEHYLKQKQKRPVYIETLFANYRG